MGDAGAIEELPLLAGDRALVAHRERREDARRRRGPERAQEAIAHRLPCFFDQVKRRISKTEKLLRSAIADIPCSPYSALEQPCARAPAAPPTESPART